MLNRATKSPTDIGEAVLASLPLEYYMPQAEQSPGYLTMFSGYGPVELMLDLAGWECDAFCEWESHLAEFLHSKHPRAAYFKDAELLAQRPMEWGIPRHRLPHVKLLIGGPPCQAMSKAGRQRGAADPRSRRLLDMFHVGHAYEVERIVLENVTELEDNDEEHGLLSAVVELAHQYKFQLVVRQRVADATEGGVTARKRLFLHFERRDIVSILPPMECMSFPITRTFKLEETLEPVETLPESAWLRGDWVPDKSVVWRLDAPTRTGTLWFGGQQHYEEIVPGMEIRLTWKKGRNSHIRKWRVLLSDYHPNRFSCEDADRNSNIRTRATPLEVMERILVPVPVYSFQGIAHSVTCFTEYCRYGCMAGLDHRCAHIPGWPEYYPIRVYHDREKARALGVPMAQFNAMKAAGFTKAQLDTVVGNVMSMTMLARVIPPVVFRSRQHWAARMELAHASNAPLVDLQSQYTPQPKEELAVLVLLDVEALPWRVHTITEQQAGGVGGVSTARKGSCYNMGRRGHQAPQGASVSTPKISSVNARVQNESYVPCCSKTLHAGVFAGIHKRAQLDTMGDSAETGYMDRNCPGGGCTSATHGRTRGSDTPGGAGHSCPGRWCGAKVQSIPQGVDSGGGQL